MKIIDNKGKLFGIINVIDLIFVLIIAVAVVGGARRLKRAPVISEAGQKGKITYLVSDIRQVSVDNIKVGQKLYHYDKGTYLGEIVDVKSEPYREKTEFEGKWYYAEVPEKYVAYVTVESDISQTAESYIAGGEQTRVGGEYRLKSKESTFFGICINIDIENK